MKKNARPPHVSNSFNGLHLHFFLCPPLISAKKAGLILLLPLLLILLLILLLPLQVVQCCDQVVRLMVELRFNLGLCFMCIL